MSRFVGFLNTHTYTHWGKKKVSFKCVRVRENQGKENAGEKVPVIHARKMSDHVVESTFELSALMKGEF